MTAFEHNIGQFVLATFENDSKQAAIYKSTYIKIVMDGHLCFSNSFINYVFQNQ